MELYFTEIRTRTMFAFGLRPFSLSAEARRAKEDVWGLPFGRSAFGLRPFRVQCLPYGRLAFGRLVFSVQHILIVLSSHHYLTFAFCLFTCRLAFGLSAEARRAKEDVQGSAFGISPSVHFSRSFVPSFHRSIVPSFSPKLPAQLRPVSYIFGI